jgi:tRNA pseudouridine55 synthase
MSKPSEPEGVLILDKPSGPTSHDVVDRVRRKFHMKRVGHAGTLDPMATGVLILLVGRATKVSQYLMGLDKEYEGVARLGQTTDSHDAEGAVVTTRPVPDLDEGAVRAAMEGFLGDQYQTPPMFSAKKIGGVPLYKLARKGKEVEREPRFIRVIRFDLLSWSTPDLAFCLACSKGTYVRTIAHDLGEKLGCGAHLTALRRTAIERFRIADALPWDEFEAGSAAEVARRLIPVYQAVPSSLL